MGVIEDDDELEDDDATEDSAGDGDSTEASGDDSTGIASEGSVGEAGDGTEDGDSAEVADSAYTGGSADVGSPVQPCHDDPVCTLTSETYVTSPTDRARLRVGVGEQVTLVYSPGDASWSLSGPGAISFNDGDDRVSAITFTAGDTAGSATITADGDNGSASLTFTIVAPSNITLFKRSGTPLKHTQLCVETGFEAYIYLHPNDVNFSRVLIREKDSGGVGTGCCTVGNGSLHGRYTIPDPAGGANVSPWTSMVNHTSRYGTNTGDYDQVGLFVPNVYCGDSAPYTTGTFSYTIIWQWRVAGKTRVTNFPALHQVHTVFADGKVQGTKGGENRSSELNDPTTRPDGWTGHS